MSGTKTLPTSLKPHNRLTDPGDAPIKDFLPPILVTSTQDPLTFDIFSPDPQNLSLREAIAIANAFPGPAVIHIAEFIDEIQLVDTLPSITEDVTIEPLPLNTSGNNARKVRVLGDGTFPILAIVDAPLTSRGTLQNRYRVRISDLSIEDGFARGGDGGDGLFLLGDGAAAVASLPGGGGAGLGGGIMIDAAAFVELVRVDIKNCTAQGGDGGLTFGAATSNPPEIDDSPVGAGGGGTSSGMRNGFDTDARNGTIFLAPVESPTDFGHGGFDSRFLADDFWRVRCTNDFDTPIGFGGHGHNVGCPTAPNTFQFDKSQDSEFGGGGGGTHVRVGGLNFSVKGGTSNFGGMGGLGDAPTVNNLGGDDATLFSGPNGQISASRGGGGAGVGGAIFSNQTVRFDTVYADIPVTIPTASPDIPVTIENFDAFSAGDGIFATWDAVEVPDELYSFKLIWTDKPHLNIYQFGQAVPAGENMAYVDNKRGSALADDPEGEVVFNRRFVPGQRYKVALSATFLSDFDQMRRRDMYRLIDKVAHAIVERGGESRATQTETAERILKDHIAGHRMKMTDVMFKETVRQSLLMSDSIKKIRSRYGDQRSMLEARMATLDDKYFVKPRGGFGPDAETWSELIVSGPEIVELVAVGNRNTPPQFVVEPETYVQAGDEYVSSCEATDAEGDSITYEVDLGPAGMTIDSNGVIEWQTSSADILSDADFANDPDANLVRIRATDSNGDSSTKEFRIEVGQLFPSRGLRFLPISNNQAKVDELFETTVAVTGNQGYPVAWEFLETPFGAGNLFDEPVVTIDGEITEPSYKTLSSWSGADTGFGPFGITELKAIRNPLLNIGIVGDSEDNLNDIFILIGSDQGIGVPAGTQLPAGDDNLSPFASFRPTLDFDVDFGIRVTSDAAAVSGQPGAYVSIIDYRNGGNTDTFLGTIPADGTPLRPGIAPYLDTEFALKNPPIAGLPNVTNEGFELVLNQFELGYDFSTKNINILAIYGNEDFISANTLPEIRTASVQNLGNDPDFTAIHGNQSVVSSAGFNSAGPTNENSFRLLWTTAPEDVGTHRLLFKASSIIDGKPVSATGEFFINVEEFDDKLSSFSEFFDFEALIIH